MAEKYYLAGIHFVTKALAKVDYPITKKDLIKQVGSKKIQWDFAEKKTMAELIKPIKIDSFESAAAFFNALVSTL